MITVVRLSQFMFDDDGGTNYNKIIHLVKWRRLEFQPMKTNYLKQL